MKSKKLKKIIFASLTSISLLGFLGGNTCLASGWSPEASWGAQSGSYSPDFGNTCMYYYDGLQGGYRYVKPMARFNFQPSAIQTIKDYHAAAQYFYTFDISLTNESTNDLNGYEAYFYSTLPDPYFDTDDNDWNGKVDETEVTCEAPQQMQAYTDYRFESYFQVLNITQYNNFEFTSQESHWDWWALEYNTVWHQKHKDRTFPWW